MSITLLQLRTESRQRADMENSTFVTDSELTNYINNSISELHDILIQSYSSEYYIKDDTFYTTSDQKDYAISTIITDNDFYKMRGLDARLNSNDWTTIRPFNFNERNRNQKNTILNYNNTNIRYRIVGSNITLSPTPDTNTEIKIWYIPVAQTLVNDSDIYDDFNNYSEYVIVDAAIKMLQKEESDVSILMAQKAALKRRIEEAANNRDAGSGDSVSDIYAENNQLYGYNI